MRRRWIGPALGLFVTGFALHGLLRRKESKKQITLPTHPDEIISIDGIPFARYCPNERNYSESTDPEGEAFC